MDELSKHKLRLKRLHDLTFKIKYQDQNHEEVDLLIEECKEFKKNCHKVKPQCESESERYKRERREYYLRTGTTWQEYVRRRDKRILDAILKSFEPKIKSKPVIIVTNYTEGGIKTSSSNIYERNPKCKTEATRLHGFNCVVCGFNFETHYGQHGKDFIEIHHIEPLYQNKGKSKSINPATDLVPVCSNCHSMIHRRRDSHLSIQELKSIYR